MRIVVFWDSISEGYNDHEMGGWVNRLKTDYMGRYLYERMVMNYGISAYTSENIINSFDAFFNAVSRREPWKEKESIVIFAFGINDSAEFKWSWNKRVSLSKFKNNIEVLIEKCQSEKLVQQVIFIGNINVDESIINLSPEGEHNFHNSEIQKYNAVINLYSQKYDYLFLDLFWCMRSEDLYDGLHPNLKGHEKIYEKVKDYLEEKI